MLRRQAVIDGDQPASRGVGKRAAQPVMGVEITADHAAAMQVDQARPGRARIAERRVDPDGERPARPGDDAVLARRDLASGLGEMHQPAERRAPRVDIVRPGARRECRAP